MRFSIIPELTTAQRNLIPTIFRSIPGLRIRNLTTGLDERWNGTIWQPLSTADARIQTVTALPIDWNNGLIVKFTMNTAVTSNATSFVNPIVGIEKRIILLNPTGGNLNFTLAPNTLHKSSALTVTVNGNRRRTLVGIYDGTAYDWELGTNKNL